MDPDMHGISPASRFLFALLPPVWVCPLKSGSLSVSAPIHTHTHARFSLTLFYLPLLVRCIARSLASSSPGLPGASSRLILTQILYLFESHFPNLTSTALYSTVLYLGPSNVKRRIPCRPRLFGPLAVCLPSILHLRLRTLALGICTSPC